MCSNLYDASDPTMRSESKYVLALHVHPFPCYVFLCRDPVRAHSVRVWHLHVGQVVKDCLVSLRKGSLAEGFSA